MTLKHNLSSFRSANHQTDSTNDQDRNEKYRLLTLVMEKKCEQIAKSNEKISVR